MEIESDARIILLLKFGLLGWNLLTLKLKVYSYEGLDARFADC